MRSQNNLDAAIQLESAGIQLLVLDAIQFRSCQGIYWSPLKFQVIGDRPAGVSADATKFLVMHDMFSVLAQIICLNLVKLLSWALNNMHALSVTA